MSPGADALAVLLRVISRSPRLPSTTEDSTYSVRPTALSAEASDGTPVVSETAPASMSSSGTDRASKSARCCAVSVNFTETPSGWPASSPSARVMPPDEAPLSRTWNFEASAADAATVSLNTTVSPPSEPSYRTDSNAGAIESAVTATSWPSESGANALPLVSYTVLGAKYRLGSDIPITAWREASSRLNRRVDVFDETASMESVMVSWPVAGWLVPSRTCTLVAESRPTSMYSLNATASWPVPASKVTSAGADMIGAAESAVTAMSTPEAGTERSPSASRNAPAETYSLGSAIARTSCLRSSSSLNAGEAVSDVSDVES